MKKQRSGFTLFELMIVAAIIIILTAVSLYNYLTITKRARLAKAYEDLAYVGYYLEFFRIDWGAYPVVPSGETFGKNTDGESLTSKISIELTGRGTGDPYFNTPSKKAITGEYGGIEYAPIGVIKSLYNPFNPSKDYHYKTDTFGSKWVLYLELPNGKYLYRTITQVNLVETDAVPEP